MQAKASKNQTVWVLLIAFVLVALCIGGLWAYVKNADAETGVTEATVAQIPGEDEIVITREKYDSFPPHQETKDTRIWTQGFGLMKSEKERLATLQKAYLEGKRPSKPVPAQPLNNGLAILPLDPNSFGGETEYYFLPKQALTDDQLLQLIAHGQEKGIPFTAETLTVKNSMRGSDSQTNRQLSAGELGRRNNLMQRAFQEGLEAQDLDLPDPVLPLSGIAYIPLNSYAYGFDLFALYPLREMTDEELLLDINKLSFDEGYTILNPAEETNLNPAADAAKARELLTDVMDMPISAIMLLSVYSSNDSTGETNVHIDFQSAMINGKQTSYSATMDVINRKPIYLGQTVIDLAYREAAVNGEPIKTTEDIHDPRWIGIAKNAVRKCTDALIVQANAEELVGLGNEEQPGVRINIIMKNGDAYYVDIRLSDGMVFSVQYAPMG